MNRLFAIALLALLTTGLRAENWMNRLPDKTYVYTLSIPGTHDAATGSGWASGYEALGDSYARTQELTIAEQWSMGIRAFDLRPCCHEDHMNLNHGIVPTVLHFDEVLCQLRDSLIANPSEFVVIHMLHESDGDQVKDVYNTRLLEVLRRSDLRSYFASFRTRLRVSDLRGKILLLSRDKYASSPIGGFFDGWTGSSDWSQQTKGKILGANSMNGTLYMQDCAETWAEGALQTKLDALQRLLDFSTAYSPTGTRTPVWVFNFASAYSKVSSFFGINISLSDGYRDNASHTNAAILDYLESHEAGPTGIILMDYAGVDESGGYAVRGRELVRALIENNFRYIEDQTTGMQAAPASAEEAEYSLQGTRLATPQHGQIGIVRRADGSVRKVLH